MSVVAVIFWVTVALILYAQVGYGLLLAGLVRLRRPQPTPEAARTPRSVSVIVAAYREEEGITARVSNLRALHRADAEVIVAVDGSVDATALRARAAGADLVLECPRQGKVPTQNAAVAVARGEILAFSDANSMWAPDALDRMVEAFGDPRVGYVCGSVRFLSAPGATNQEGLYWRYEMLLRALESRLASITAGNGAIYAVRREAYEVLPAVMSHDIALPFRLVKAGWRAIYVPEAQATEKMAPTIEGEFRRKRRMASRTWPSVLGGGMFSLRGYGPTYALMIISHRLLRYTSPLLHLVALLANALLVGSGALYVVALIGQGLVLGAAAIAGRVPTRVTLIARYYVWTTASLAAGFFDSLRNGGRVMWEPVEGTR